MSRIAILGGGSWGTGLAVVLSNSRRKHDVRLWVREFSLAESIERDRENKAYLPGVSIPSGVRASTKLEDVLHEAQIVVGAVPSAYTRGVFAFALPSIPREAVLSAPPRGWSLRRTCE
jgi:glycerol-3-phosphate dehydrogenase (NAD(P)+)